MHPPPQTHTLHTYHLLEQQRVAFSKEHAEVQDLWDVEQEVVVEDLSERRGGNEVILGAGRERLRDCLSADALQSKSKRKRNNSGPSQGTG